MRINVHAHIFNFRSVFTDQTLRILLDRLGSEGWPPFLVDAAEELLKKVIKADYVDEQTALSVLVNKLNASASLQSYLDSLSSAIPGDVHLLAKGDLTGLLVDGGVALLHKLGNFLSQQDDFEKSDIQDFLGFLLIGIRSSIEEVADILVSSSPPDAVMTALMMDISASGTADEALFAKQISDTSAAALRYPGTILPFVAVDPRRNSYLTRMTTALEKQGFVGVKMYPSLGYDVNDPRMTPVYDYCEKNEIPILFHCNHGGFYRDKTQIENAAPYHWANILDAYPALRVCFAHFGGDDDLATTAVDPNSWTAQIVELLQKHSNAYTDISFHTRCMDGGQSEENYFAHLSLFLAMDKVRDQILFGSDFHLVRQRVREENLWKYFDHHFTPADWNRITQVNPARFLGISGTASVAGLGDFDGTANPDGGPMNNIQQHLRWIASQPNAVGRIPAPWALALMAQVNIAVPLWKPNPYGSAWIATNPAHAEAAVWLDTNLSQSMSVDHEFVPLGARLVRDLANYPTLPSSPQVLPQWIQFMTDTMFTYLTGPAPTRGGGVLRPSVTIGKAKTALAGLFADPDLELYHFGRVVDQLLLFS